MSLTTKSTFTTPKNYPTAKYVVKKKKRARFLFRPYVKKHFLLCETNKIEDVGAHIHTQYRHTHPISIGNISYAKQHIHGNYANFNQGHRINIQEEGAGGVGGGICKSVIT